MKNMNVKKIVSTPNLIKNNIIFNPDKKSLSNINGIKKYSYNNKIANNFNDQKVIIDSFLPKWLLGEIAKYPKGTFKRVSKIVNVNGKKHQIVFEGIKVDFDVTAEGLQLMKPRMSLC